MKWYKTLTIQQRISLKELCEVICGIRFDMLVRLFGLRESVQIIYNKLKLEGFDV